MLNTNFIDELYAYMVGIGFAPTKRVGLYGMPVLADTVSELIQSDVAVTLDLPKLYKERKNDFLVSCAWMYLELDAPYVPGFYTSIGSRVFQFSVMLQNSYKSITRDVQCVYVPPESVPLPDLSSEDQDYLLNGNNWKKDVDAYFADGLRASDVAVVTQPYDSYKKNYAAFAERYPLMHLLVSQIPSDYAVYAPGDGVGVVSLACIQLDRKYLSSEPNAIGQRARELGIIDSADTADQFLSRVPLKGKRVVILSNLSIFSDLSNYCALHPVLVLEERCLFPGAEYNLRPVYGTQYKLWTNIDYPFIVSNYLGDVVANYDNHLSKKYKYVTNDPRAYVNMKSRGYKVGTTQGTQLWKMGVEVADHNAFPVSFNFRDNITNEDYLLSSRKYANAKCGRYGQIAKKFGLWSKFDRAQHIVSVRSGYFVSRDYDYHGTRILEGFEMPFGVNVLSVQLSFDPIRIKYLRAMQELIPVKIVSSVRKRRKYHVVLARQWEASDVEG